MKSISHYREENERLKALVATLSTAIVNNHHDYSPGHCVDCIHCQHSGYDEDSIGHAADCPVLIATNALKPCEHVWEVIQGDNDEWRRCDKCELNEDIPPPPEDVAGDYLCNHAYSIDVVQGDYEGEVCPKCKYAKWNKKPCEHHQVSMYASKDQYDPQCNQCRNKNDNT